MPVGNGMTGGSPGAVDRISEIRQRDLSSVGEEEQERELAGFASRLRSWRERLDGIGVRADPRVSVETPVFKGAWLMPCIESVLYQSSTSWALSLRWDGGDDLSRRILEVLATLDHPALRVHFGDNIGIARTRRFLSEHASGDYILSLDDDDMLAPNTVERFLACLETKPWSGIVRARREFIDGVGHPVDSEPWFPFTPRRYQHGMVTDLFNHSQPALISRAAYEQTSGWEGFEEFLFAGADCDIFTKVEEVAPIVLLDEVLYYYRLSDKRASLVIKDEAAFEMWRRLADRTIARIGLALERKNDGPVFEYARLPRPRASADQIDVIVSRRGSDVAADSATPSLLDSTRQSLARCGIPGAAIQVVSRNAGRPIQAAKNEAASRASRPIICFLDEGVTLDGPGTIESWLAALDDRDADVAAPKVVTPSGAVLTAEPRFDAQGRPTLGGSGRPDPGGQPRVVSAPWLASMALLVRREVMKATGGFDEAYEDEQIAAADFGLKARYRDFSCVYVGTSTVVSERPETDRATSEDDLVRFRAKWADMPDLLERSIAEEPPPAPTVSRQLECGRGDGR